MLPCEVQILGPALLLPEPLRLVFLVKVFRTLPGQKETPENFTSDQNSA